MNNIPIRKLFENMVNHVMFPSHNHTLARLPVPGYYSQGTKTLTLAEGLDDEKLFCTAYTILLKCLHSKDPETLCRKHAAEACRALPEEEKRWVIDYLESKISPLKLV